MSLKVAWDSSRGIPGSSRIDKTVATYLEKLGGVEMVYNNPACWRPRG
jgi:hypothetical protein